MTGSTRTVVLLEEAERGGLRVKLVGWPRGTSGPSRAIKLDGLPRQLDSADAVERYGRDLMSALRKQRELREAVDDALRATDDEVRPLCFMVDGPGAEELALCWEMLWEKSERFLALNPRWPIGRIASFTPTPTRVFRAPLEILAVMSALGEEARPEWVGLQAAAAYARERGLAVHVTAVVGEQALLEELRATAEADPGWLTVVALEGKHTLRSILSDRPPHILHFFCHGRTEVGEGHLELATIGDRAEPPEDAKASVVVTMRELATVIDSKQLWFVTLNCCSGARAMADVQSIAHSAVAAGAGAAVGWREAVDARDANLLCRTLYLELLGQLARQLTSAGREETIELELATSSYGTRDLLRSTHDGDPLRWTLPVTYLAANPLSVMVLEPQPLEADPGGDEAREAGGAAIRAASRAAALNDAKALMAGAPAAVLQEMGSRIAAATARVRTSGPGADG